MRALRVAQVINQLALGGTEYNVVKLVNRLDPPRFQSTIVALRDAQPNVLGLLAPHVKVWELHRREGFDTGLILRLSRRLRSERIDVVHSHNWSTYLYAALSARLAGVPVVIHGEHGLEKDNLVETSRRVVLRRLLARITDQFTGVSREICERIETRWGGDWNQIQYVPNGVDLERFGQTYPAAEIRRSLGIAPGDPVIASVGAFRPVKDFGTLVRAFSLVLEKHPNAHLLLIGSDQGREFELKTRAESPELGPALDRVKFLGVRLDTPELMSILNVYVNSSLYEGMSNTILEAMASRIPVVATAVGGTPDLVKAGLSGILVPLRDPAALAGGIDELLSDPDRALAMGLRGRVQIEREHSFSRMIALNADLYETTYERKTRRPGVVGIAKSAVGRLSAATGLTDTAEWLCPRSLAILTYHRVLPAAEKRRSSSQAMILPTDVFDRHMAMLAHEYRVLSMDQVLDHFRAGRPFPPRAVHVTFDDGYADNYAHALPILVRRAIPATFFLATGPIDTGAPLWWDELGQALRVLHGRRPEWARPDFVPPALRQPLRQIFQGRAPMIPIIDRCIRILNGSDAATRLGVAASLTALAAGYREASPPRIMLTWDEVRAMQRQGMSFGGHTVRHVFLTELEDSEGRLEVQTCLERIGTEAGVRPRTFSYPRGG